MRYGSYMAIPVPTDRHWRLDSRQVLPDQTFHRGPFCTGVWPHCWRGFLFPSGGDWARQTHQTADLGHGWTREVQVCPSIFRDILCIENISRILGKFTLISIIYIRASVTQYHYIYLFSASNNQILVCIYTQSGHGLPRNFCFLK